MKLSSDHPGKRAAERLYLLYTPVWGLAAGLVMVTGLGSRWGGGPLLALGFGLWIILLGLGLALAPEEERKRPFFRRYHVKLQAFVALLSFFGNYFGTRYFYEILDMNYGFKTSVVWNDVPLFLYPLTAVYFTTYAVLLNVVVRAVGARRGRPPGSVDPLALAVASFALAFLETLLNDNPFLRDAFCYGNKGLALSLGTALYGVHFVFAGPLWFVMDERPEDDSPMRNALLGPAAAFALCLVSDEIVKYHIAPRFTTVVEGRVGLYGKHPGPTCLRGR